MASLHITNLKECSDGVGFVRIAFIPEEITQEYKWEKENLFVEISGFESECLSRMVLRQKMIFMGDEYWQEVAGLKIKPLPTFA